MYVGVGRHVCRESLYFLAVGFEQTAMGYESTSYKVWVVENQPLAEGRMK